eukprot:11208584-Lingulodinium_polyedra.AAC.1
MCGQFAWHLASMWAFSVRRNATHCGGPAWHQTTTTLIANCPQPARPYCNAPTTTRKPHRQTDGPPPSCKQCPKGKPALAPRAQ